jgi:hypothetical protein
LIAEVPTALGPLFRSRGDWLPITLWQADRVDNFRRGDEHLFCGFRREL